jgi:hypothetical protein
MIAPYYLDQYVEEVTEQRTMPAQSQPNREARQAMLNEADDVVIAGPNDSEETPRSPPALSFVNERLAQSHYCLH